MIAPVTNGNEQASRGSDRARLAQSALGAGRVRTAGRAIQGAGHAYGKDFVYDEMAVVSSGTATDFSMPDSASGPKPGEGPSKEEREIGFYDLTYIGIDRDGRQVRAAIHGEKDPGYGSTSMILAETALCLLKSGAKVPGGSWMPGAALGQDLVTRLQANAGLSFSDRST